MSYIETLLRSTQEQHTPRGVLKRTLATGDSEQIEHDGTDTTRFHVMSTQSSIIKEVRNDALKYRDYP